MLNFPNNPPAHHEPAGGVAAFAQERDPIVITDDLRELTYDARTDIVLSGLRDRTFFCTASRAFT
jgi:hypothetical protein